jgi:hypothetical protein
MAAKTALRQALLVTLRNSLVIFAVNALSQHGQGWLAATEVAA